jgi:rubrerythrin
MIDRERKGLTSLEALGVAIRSEMDSREVYQELSERVEDRVIRRRFELLASEEEQHIGYLTDRYKEMAGEDVPLKLPPSNLPKDMLTREQRSHWSLEQVLDMAIEEERHSREFYLRAARESDDLSGRAMFRFLADMEYQHWMTLAQEKDMLVRYPSYGTPGGTPWRAEKNIVSKPGKEGG